jgi:hypothetical protein
MDSVVNRDVAEAIDRLTRTMSQFCHIYTTRRRQLVESTSSLKNDQRGMSVSQKLSIYSNVVLSSEQSFYCYS